MSDRPKVNTDRELWRGPDEGNGDYYADSIHVTTGGGIGINCGGLVIVKPLAEWHRLAALALPSLAGAQATGDATGWPQAVHPMTCGNADCRQPVRVLADRQVCDHCGWTVPLPWAQPPVPPLSEDDRREAFLALIGKWEADAEGVDAMGYAQQADRIRACADDLSALLAQRPDNKEPQT